MLSISAIFAQMQQREKEFAAFGDKLGRGYGNLYVGGNKNDVVYNDTDCTRLLMGNGNNTVVSNGHSNKILCGTGDNKIVAMGRSNYIEAEGGNNKIYFQGDRSTIIGGKDNDYIVFSGNYNNVSGGAGNDQIFTASLNLSVQNGSLVFGGMQNLSPYKYGASQDYDPTCNW